MENIIKHYIGLSTLWLLTFIAVTILASRGYFGSITPMSIVFVSGGLPICLVGIYMFKKDATGQKINSIAVFVMTYNISFGAITLVGILSDQIIVGIIIFLGSSFMFYAISYQYIKKRCFTVIAISLITIVCMILSYHYINSNLNPDKQVGVFYL